MLLNKNKKLLNRFKIDNVYKFNLSFQKPLPR